MALIDELLKDLEKTAETETPAEEKEKEKEKEKKKEKEKEKKEEKKEEIVEKLSSFTTEKLAMLESYVDQIADSEKIAEFAKQAEELETQGRFMYHGFAKEQIKCAYLLDQISDNDVVKVAETLNWDVNDIFKTGAAMPGEELESVNEGEGTQEGPAGDMIAGNKTIVPAKVPGQLERKPELSSELGEIKNIINQIKAVKKEKANLEFNDNH